MDCNSLCSILNLSLNQEEWIKGSQDAEIGRVVNEILRGRQAAAAYIDARSGGGFFGAEAHISGDVVGGKQQRTVFHSTDGRQANVGIGSVVAVLLDKTKTVYGDQEFSGANQPRGGLPPFDSSEDTIHRKCHEARRLTFWFGFEVTDVRVLCIFASGSKRPLLASRPLRTARESFPSSRSSLSNAR